MQGASDYDMLHVSNKFVDDCAEVGRPELDFARRTAHVTGLSNKHECHGADAAVAGQRDEHANHVGIGPAPAEHVLTDLRWQPVLA